MIVTINTDASFNGHYKIGAYAFWIVCNQGRILFSGPINEAINPTDAEIHCMVNALKTLLNSKFTDVSRIIINSDALHAFTMIKASAKIGTSQKMCYQILEELRIKYKSKKPIHEFRHVKAHSCTS